MTYTGEAGSELFVPSRHGPAPFEAVVAAGAEFGLGLAGLCDTRLAAHGEGEPRLHPRRRQLRDPARGRPEVHVRIRHRLPRSRRLRRSPTRFPPAGWCRSRSTIPNPLLRGGEPLLRDGKPVGYARTAAYGHTLGRAVGLAMIEVDEPVAEDVDRGGRVHHARVRGPPCGRRTDHREPPPPLRPHRRPLVVATCGRTAAAPCFGRDVRGRYDRERHKPPHLDEPGTGISRVGERRAVEAERREVGRGRRYRARSCRSHRTTTRT